MGGKMMGVESEQVFFFQTRVAKKRKICGNVLNIFLRYLQFTLSNNKLEHLSLVNI